ncbi:MAG TPA: 5'-3' exonuclease H3TH domain-containing protein, partial [Acidimicrobiales bacterium]|nr:5'-3' exonuclease H3TH domain-containing protein [Acidimicrobiales bacterium]
MPSPTTANAKPGTPLLLLDGMSLAFRAFFALPPDLATTAGVVTNALYGFASMLVNLVRDHTPSGLAVAFDLPGGTFRDKVVSDYKAGRAETPDDLFPQFEMIRTLLAALAIPVVDAVGFEADDVLATLATEARDRAQTVIIVTGDRDSYQLVEDPYIQVLYNRRGVSDYVLYDEHGIQERTGVTPENYPFLAALRGDPSDNLPGVPGVGEKTAAKLVNEYGDIDSLYAHLDALSPKLRENLAANLERVRMNAEVIPLIRDVPLTTTIDQLQLGGWNTEDAEAVFAEFELKTLWPRYLAVMNDGLLGPPAPGGGPLTVGGSETPAETGPAADQPAWLASPEIVAPDDVAGAVVGLETMVAAAQFGAGN